MRDLQIFKNNQFGSMRAIEINNVPYFCLTDLCRILDIKNASDCKRRLSKDGVVITEVGVQTGYKRDGKPITQNVKATFINESNLYKVIFQSRKAEAEEFTDWVTNEVLPNIRKNGGYIAGQETLSDDELIQKALIVANRKIAEKNKQLANQKHKVLFADSVATSENSMLIGDLAKLIKQNGYDIGQNRLFVWLRNNGYLGKHGERRNVPTQKAMELGLFEVKVRIVDNPDGSVRTTRTTKVTGKGQVYFINKFLNK